MPDAKWSALQKCASILRSAGDDGMTRATYIPPRFTEVYRWRKRLLEAGLITALEDRKRAFPGGWGRLSEEQEHVIGEVIEASL